MSFSGKILISLFKLNPTPIAYKMNHLVIVSYSLIILIIAFWEQKNKYQNSYVFYFLYFSAVAYLVDTFWLPTTLRKAKGETNYLA